ncbi:MAG TPA: hypothetical protein DDW17_02075 [Deltaproteobacteria bacterium]|nr:hypothetical protein [Deltaproteobacteria bacterium]
MQMELNFSPQLNYEERRIYQLLKYGRSNAISVRQIAESTGYDDVQIRNTIRHLILDHNILIGSAVSNPPGFYIPETKEEVEQATKSLRHRGISILVRAAKLQKLTLEEIFNQGRLEFKESAGHEV